MLLNLFLRHWQGNLQKTFVSVVLSGFHNKLTVMKKINDRVFSTSHFPRVYDKLTNTGYHYDDVGTGGYLTLELLKVICLQYCKGAKSLTFDISRRLKIVSCFAECSK